MRTQLRLTIFLVVNFAILIKSQSAQTKHVFVEFGIAYRSFGTIAIYFAFVTRDLFHYCLNTVLQSEDAQ